MRHGPAPRFDEQAVDVPVITSGEFDDPVAARETAGQAESTHRRFRARADHPHVFDRGDRLDDHLGQLGFRFVRRAEAGPFRQSAFDGGDDLGVAVAQDQRPPGADVIEQPVPVDVDEERALSPVDEERLSPDGAERAGRAIHPAGDHALRPLERRSAFLAVH